MSIGSHQAGIARYYLAGDVQLRVAVAAGADFVVVDALQ